jgi:hypothetical protein
MRTFSPSFYNGTATFQLLGAGRGASGGERPYPVGPAVTLPAMVYPASSDTKVAAGMEDLVGGWEIHVTSDPGPQFDEKSRVTTSRTGATALTINRRMAWADNLIVFVAGGRQ